MPFHTLIQIISRTFLWVILFSAEAFSQVLVKPYQNSYLFDVLLFLLSLTTFFLIGVMSRDRQGQDLREICVYEMLLFSGALVFYLAGAEPAAVVNSLMSALFFMKFGRLLWPGKSSDDQHFIAWPVFGLLGFFNRKSTAAAPDAPSPAQARSAYAFMLLCLALGFGLPLVGYAVSAKELALLPFVLAPFLAKRVLADIHKRHAEQERQRTEAERKQRELEVTQALARAREEHNQVLAAKNEELACLNTELAATNTALAEKNAEIAALLVEKEHAQARLAGFNASLRNAAHDLRQPMTGVRYCADMLMALTPEERAQEEVWQERCHLVNDAIFEMFETIEGAVHTAKIVTGILPYKPQVVDLNALVKQFQEVWLEGENRCKMDRVIVYPARRLRAFVWTDALILKRIIRNLIANAIHCSRKSPAVLIALRIRQQHAVMVVRDAGPGIPEGEQSRDEAANFAAFAARIAQENRAAPHAHRSGHGLGINSVLTLCKAAGLTMHLRSKMGKGSVFTLYLPLADESQYVPPETELSRLAGQEQACFDELMSFCDVPMVSGEFAPSDVGWR